MAVAAERVARVSVCALIAALVFLQKLAIPGTGAPLLIPILYATLVVLAAFARLQVSLARLVAFSLFLTAALVAQAFVVGPISMSSLIGLVILYAPLVFRLHVDQATFVRILSFYQSCMVVGAGLAIGQSLAQIPLGGGLSLPTLHSVVPESWLIPGYVYVQPLQWGSSYLKPNGLFFLEVSFLSQFTAVAFVIELVMFGRPWRLALFGAVLLGSFAGTGLLLLALVSVPLLLRLPPRFAAGLAVAVVAMAVIAGLLGYFDQVARRLGEFGTDGTSAYGRFVLPVIALGDALNQTGILVSGLGAGNLTRGADLAFWPAVKLVIEYGVVTAVLFEVFLLVALFEAAPSRRLAATLFVLHGLMGGYLHTPVIIFLCVALGSLLRPRAGPSPPVARVSPLGGRTQSPAPGRPPAGAVADARLATAREGGAGC